jgi:hypothetical protein
MTETSMTPRRAYQRLDRRLGAVTPEELAAVRRILRIPGSVSPPSKLTDCRDSLTGGR